MARILIVEDNPANLKLATLLLSRANHVVLPAMDAEAGLALALAGHPDLILMDIQLPGMDGLTATSILKTNPATAAIPVIALTAMAMKSDQEKSRLAGCDAYLTKPLRYQELYAAIDEFLAMAASGAPVSSFSVSAGDEGWPERRDDSEVDRPPVDVRVLEGLVGHDRSVLLDFLDTFQSSTAKIAHELVGACSRHEAVAAGAQAHKLKSSARAVGAIDLGHLCTLLETAGRAKDVQTLTRLQPRFEEELRVVNAAIDGLRRSWAPAHAEFSPRAGSPQKRVANE